jgi:UPF0755 protein
MENLPNEFVQPSVLNRKKISFYLFLIIFFLVSFYFLFLSAPADFPLSATVQIEKGASLRSVSALLEKEHLIRSRVAFEFFVIIFNGEKHIISANYLFENKLPVFEIARRIAGGEHRMAPIVVTIPEGFNAREIADTFALKLANFSKDKFLMEVKEKEGYLFPDTYFFLPNANETDVVRSMTNNFQKKITPFLFEILSLNKSEKDIVIMASLVEGEAKGETDRGVIAGILWKRISIHMPLQVDSAPETYKIKGLPENPIGNPGLAAITASIRPQNSPYLYYLHDKNGIVHYAKTFAEHQANIKKYLK